MLDLFSSTATLVVNLPGLVGLGFLIGVLSGWFGVGGGFLLTPMLNVVFSIPYDIAVGSGLCQMVGTTAAASLKHRSYGHIDYRLALFTLIGSIGGVELGARLLVKLKKLGSITIHTHSISKMYLWITVIYIVLLLLVGVFMFLESRKAKRSSNSEVVKMSIAIFSIPERARDTFLLAKTNLKASSGVLLT